ncbi:MAG: pyridoxal kinase PdxY [Rhodospirillales bacterium]|nr:pyridoxal kinase PdxY [Rhodospirillales bacterium]
MAILSIQSYVCFGHVGNAAALFPLQRLGFEVWPVPTVVLSNHPGYGSRRGHAVGAEAVAALVDGVAERGAFERCRAVLSGYLGAAATGRIAVNAARRVKTASPHAIFCCDPVMGDREEGLYVPDDIVRFFREEASTAADILVPNAFELEALAEQPVTGAAGAVAAARKMLARGPEMIVVTSVPAATGQDSARTATTLLVTASAAWSVATPALSLRAKGAGDMFTALFLGYLLHSRDPADALGRAVSSAFAVIEATVAADAQELTLIEAQDAMIDPPRRFAAERIF